VSNIALTPQRIELVRESFAKIVPSADATASLFYQRLFEIAPQVRPLFQHSIKAQGRKLMSAIALAVGSLQNLPELVPVIEELGRRHLGYGVRDEDYDLVAEALLWTLDKGLGADFTAEVKDAWVAVYATLADTMKGAARQGAAHQPNSRIS
jgi:hemoglobin-like flavoprotein